MTTVADLLALPIRDTLAPNQTQVVLMAFLRQFDPVLAQNLRDRLRGEDRVPPEASVDVLLYGEEGKHRNVLGRLTYAGRPVALIRQEWSSTEEEASEDERRDRALVRLVDRAAAVGFTEACVALLRKADADYDRMQESEVGDDVSDLLDFGPTADADLADGSLRFRQQTRLAFLTNRNDARAVMAAVEGGTFAVGVKGTPFDGFHGYADESEALEAFLLRVAPLVQEGAKVRHEVTIVHGRKGESAGLVDHKGTLRCSRIVSGSKEPITLAEGEDALPAFMQAVRDIAGNRHESQVAAATP